MEEKPNDADPGESIPKISPWLTYFAIAFVVVFFFYLIGAIQSHNLWAGILLAIAIRNFHKAYIAYRQFGLFNSNASSPLNFGLLILTIALFLLFGLSWKIYWPIFLLFPSMSSLIGGIPFTRPQDKYFSKTLLRHRPWAFFSGLTFFAVSITLVAINLSLFDPNTIIPFEFWFGVFFFIPVLGGIFTAIWLFIKNDSIILVLSNLGVSLTSGILGFIILSNTNNKLLLLSVVILLALSVFGFFTHLKVLEQG